MGQHPYGVLLFFCSAHVTRYLADTNWDEWGTSEEVIKESTAHKTLIQTAKRMKTDGLSIKQISRYTGLTVEKIEEL